MNYIELINNFWAYTEEKEISSSDTSVYFALLKFNNSLNWIKTFRCDYPIICQYARVSKNTFYRSLDSLQDLGLISYQKGERNTLKPKISVLNLKNKKGIIKEQEGNNKGTEKEQNEEQKGNLYKLLNKETIKLINSKTTIVANFLNKNLQEVINNISEEEILTIPIVVEKEKVAPKRKVEFTELIEECFLECLSYFPDHLHPKTESSVRTWKITIRELHYTDGIPLEVIIKTVKAVRADPFWKENFLSLNKLRKNNPDGVKYIVVFNEKFNGKSANKSNEQIFAETRRKFAGMGINFK